MKGKIAIFLVAAILLTAFAGKVEAAPPPPQPPVQPVVYETVSIIVACQTANLTITSAVTSDVNSLVHFPAGINMGSDQWLNVTGVSVVFSETFCSLNFCFENVDESTARSIANSLKVDFDKTFNIIYTYNSTYTEDSIVKVIYMGLGVANLTQRTQELIEECLAQDLGRVLKNFYSHGKRANSHHHFIRHQICWKFQLGVQHDSDVLQEHTDRHRCPHNRCP